MTRKKQARWIHPPFSKNYYLENIINKFNFVGLYRPIKNEIFKNIGHNLKITEN